MDLLPMASDNISELLMMIIEFTQNRQKVLTQNINCMYRPDFAPMDLAVDEFSDVLNTAIDEHLHNHRLVLCDTDNIKFGEQGDIEVAAIIDEDAYELFEQGQEEYIERQIEKLLENALNQRVAAELLKEREGIAAIID